jgi:hypothetical protein
LPGGLAPGTAHLKKERNFREQAFCRYPQSRFVVDDAVLSFEKSRRPVENKMLAQSCSPDR